MKVLVGSKNPVKIGAVRKAFGNYFHNFEVEGVEVNLDIPDQPVGDETFRGAERRARYLFEHFEADFFVGIEGGIYKISGTWYSFGAVCIVDRHGRVGRGVSPMFTLPDFIITRLLKGEELGVVMDELLNDHNTKQKFGAIGHLSRGIINRENLYVSGVIMALIPFLNKDWYFKIPAKDK